MIREIILNYADADTEAVGCSSPGEVPYATRDRRPGPFPVGSVVTYTCHSGFGGGGSVTCQENRMWTPWPTCNIRSNYPGVGDCGNPSRVFNAYEPNAEGTTPAGRFRFGAVLTYNCLPGYSGGGSITCQVHGQWSYSPTCIATGIDLN